MSPQNKLKIEEALNPKPLFPINASTKPRIEVLDYKNLGNDLQLTVGRDCSIDKLTYKVTFMLSQLYAWKIKRLHIQSAFLNLSNAEREFLMSNTTPREWAELWRNNSIDKEPFK